MCYNIVLLQLKIITFFVIITFTCTHNVQKIFCCMHACMFILLINWDLTCFTAVDRERRFLPHKGLTETWTSTENLTGVRCGSGRRAVRVHAALPGHRLHHQSGHLAGVGHVHQPWTWRPKGELDTSTNNWISIRYHQTPSYWIV